MVKRHVDMRKTCCHHRRQITLGKGNEMAHGDEGDSSRLSRRHFVLRGGAGAGGLLMAGAVAACGGSGSSGGSGGSAGTIKIGFTSPLTGPAAGFGEPDPYVVGLARKAFTNGIKVAGKTYGVQIIEKDNQASPSVS